MKPDDLFDALILGGGFAGLSAAIYLGRARRHTLVIDSGRSLGTWEPAVQNYLGFPDGISGVELLRRGREQVQRLGLEIVADTIVEAGREADIFVLKGEKGTYRGRKLLSATGLIHLPPDIPGVADCLGHSMFFCKDCDGLKVQGKRVGVFGINEQTVRYALGILSYTSSVVILTNGASPLWGPVYAKYCTEYGIPVHEERIADVEHDKGMLKHLTFDDGRTFGLDALFTTRGDLIHNTLAKSLGAELDRDGQVLVDCDGRTNVPGLFAAGCVTPANCQMIIACGQGATVGQGMNLDLFDESLKEHRLHRFDGVTQGSA